MKTLSSIAVTVLAVHSAAAVRLGTPFADGMILQRERDVPVWGVAASGETVRVTFAGNAVEAAAGADGKWMVRLPKMPACREGRVLTVTGSASRPVTLNDVLVGEVWIVSGQSNAECPLWGPSPRFRDRNGALVAQMTDKPLVRLCHASNYRYSREPKEFASYPVRWRKFDRESLGASPSFSAVGAYFALELYSALEIPVGIVGSYWGGTRIEPWIPREGFAARGLDPDMEVRGKPAHQQPSVLWNEMVNPWAPMAMRGLVWYQGCSNSADPETYAAFMHALYDGWSRKFANPALKLYFVQIAPWGGGGHPEFQQAQAKFAAEEPNAGMAVINDLGNLTDIHPNEKMTVAKRLAVHALRRDYGFDGIRADSPTLKGWELEKDRVVLSFRDVKEFYVYNEQYASTSNGFEICGADGVWKPAQIVNFRGVERHGKPRLLGNVNGNRIVLSTEGIVRPRGVRYLYARPWHGSIYSEVNLPLGSFAIDLAAEPSLRPLDLQAKIDAAAQAGGGTVTVGPGDWEARPFSLKTGVTLELADGAVVYASTNLSDYAAQEGERTFVSATGADGVKIVGKGVLDGRGFAFRETAAHRMTGESQPQALPVMMRFTRCRDVTLEDFTYRRGGAWGCHLRNCDGVVMRRVTCFNHVNKTNDGIDIESRNVLIEDCDIDADDDAIVLKTESDIRFAVTNVTIRNCRLASCCNAFKIGTGSYCDFRDVTVENCEFARPNGNFRFDWSRYTGKKGLLSGIAGMALEVCDGGRMENVTVRNVTVDGYLTPVFVRFERRHDPPPGQETYLRNVLIENVRATVADSRVASSITGVPGRRPSNVVVRNCIFTFPGGGTAEDAARPVPEKETAYPDAIMFDRQNLPAWAFYVRHADGILLENVRCEKLGDDAREKYVFEDADVTVR